MELNKPQTAICLLSTFIQFQSSVPLLQTDRVFCSDSAVLVHTTRSSWVQLSAIWLVLKHLPPFWWVISFEAQSFKRLTFLTVNLVHNSGEGNKNKISSTDIKQWGRSGRSVFCKAPSALRPYPSISSSHCRVQRASHSVGQGNFKLNSSSCPALPAFCCSFDCMSTQKKEAISISPSAVLCCPECSQLLNCNWGNGAAKKSQR